MDIQPSPLPIVITCKINSAAATYFNGLRQKYFPPAKNLLNAHLTLFHHIQLPAGEVLDIVHRIVFNIKQFELLTGRIAFTGRGVAFVINSPELIALHKKLQQSFKAVLTPQDRQALWPHITIQNKAAASESKALADELQLKFEPLTFTALGLQLFYYMNGHWQFIADSDFK